MLIQALVLLVIVQGIALLHSEHKRQYLKESLELEESISAYLQDDIKNMVIVLDQACDLAEEGWSYASPFFREKWDFEGRIDLCRVGLVDEQRIKKFSS